MAEDPSLEPEDEEVHSAPKGEVITAEEWDAAVAKWVDQDLRGSVVAQNTEVWNYLMKVLPHLRDLLHKEA